MEIKPLRETLIDMGWSVDEVDREIADAKEELNALIDEGSMMEAEDICQSRWGLEPDYLEDILF